METAPLTNANSPSGGSDHNGITALLNSMTHLRGDNNAGMVQNLKLGKTMFRENMEKTKMLIQSYFDQGGTAYDNCGESGGFKTSDDTSGAVHQLIRKSRRLQRTLHRPSERCSAGYHQSDRI
jgi:hypothetical protein